MRFFESMRQSAKHSIFIRFSVLILSLTLIISISLDFFVQKKLASIIEASTKDDAATILQSLDLAVAQLLEDNEPAAIQRLLDNTASNRMIQSLSLYNTDLTMKMESGTPLLSDEKNNQILHKLLFSQNLINYGRDSVTGIFYYAVPIRGQSVLSEISKDWHGILLLTFNPNYEQEQLNATLFLNRFNLFLIDVIILFTVWTAVYAYWIKPLNQFKNLSEAIALRNYEVRFNTNDKYELGELAKTFNYMTSEIQRYMFELSTAKDLAVKESDTKMQFFANMSHEIRTPLNLILGYLSLLEEDSLPTDSQQKFTIIKNAGEQLLAIINDILDIAKFDLDEIVLEQKIFSLPEILIELFAVFQPIFEEKRISLKINLEPNTPHLWLGDSYRIKQILNNLITNALKFTHKGLVQLSAYFADGYLILSIKDSGVGIAQEKQTLIFEPFKQTDMSTTREYGGTGLGLAIVKKLCEAMGGNIELISAPTEGSVFIAKLKLAPVETDPEMMTENIVVMWQLKDIEISDLIEMVVNSLPDRISKFDKAIEDNDIQSLGEYVHALKGVTGNFKMTELYKPLVMMDEMLKQHGLMEENFYQAYQNFMKAYSHIPQKYFPVKVALVHENLIGSNTLKILLAEDIQENRMLIKHMLNTLPCQLDEAEDGEKALQKIKETQYDLLLLDMHMPIVDGMTVLKTLRADKTYDNLLIVAMTASIQHHQVSDYYQFGINHILPKPVDKTQLRNYVLDVISLKNSDDDH